MMAPSGVCRVVGENQVMRRSSVRMVRYTTAPGYAADPTDFTAASAISLQVTVDAQGAIAVYELDSLWRLSLLGRRGEQGHYVRRPSSRHAGGWLRSGSTPFMARPNFY